MPVDSRDAQRPFPPVRIVSGGAFEVIAQLSAFTSGPARASLESGKAWIRDVRALAGPELVGRVERWALPVYGALAPFALATAPPHDAGRLGAVLRAAPAAFLRRHVIGAEAPSNRSMVSPDAFERALDGDAAAQAELRRGLGLTPGGRRALDRILAMSAEALAAEIADVVEDWSRLVFPAFADGALAAIGRDVETRTALLAEREPRAFVQAVLDGVDPGDAWGATDVVVAPTVALRPFVIPVDAASAVIYLAPVADESLADEPGAPPRRLVKLGFAMGDPLRLRILRALASDGLTASELAERLGVDRTTLHHHLGILRSAGLLAIRDEGVNGWRYARRTDGLAEATRALEAYLGPDEGAGSAASGR